MSPAAAVGSLYARSSGAYLIGAFAALSIGSMMLVVHKFSSFLETGQRESLITLGVAIGLLWLPAIVAATVRMQLLDARERMLPDATVHAAMAVAVLLGAYVLPAMSIAAWLGRDLLASAAVLGLIGAAMWRAGWANGRSYIGVLAAATLMLPWPRSFLVMCLQGGHPFATFALLVMAGLAITAVVVMSIHDLRSDRSRPGAEDSWIASFIRRVWKPKPLPPWMPVDATAWSWARHLSRGWRAEIAPLGLVLFAFVGSSCMSLIAAIEHWTPADLGEASIVGVMIVSLQWLFLLGSGAGPTARADAARPVGRARFAALVLLVAARSLVGSWACLWAGSFAGFSAGLYLWSGTTSLPQALKCCGQNLVLLPVFIAYFAWMLAARGRGEMFAMLMISQAMLLASVLPMLPGPVWWLTTTPASAAIEVAIGIAACWLVYWRWRTLEIR